MACKEVSKHDPHQGKQPINKNQTQLAGVLELEKKDFKMFIVTVFHLFRKLTKDTIKKKKTQIKFLEIKYTMC